MHSQLLSLFASTLFANTLFGNTLFGITLLFAASTPTLVAQLEVHGIKKLAELIVHTKSVLREQPAATGADLWHMMVAHLRLGQAHEARRLLLHYPDSKQPEFVLAAFATLQRTTGEDLLDSTRRRTLERATAKQPCRSTGGTASHSSMRTRNAANTNASPRPACWRWKARRGNPAAATTVRFRVVGSCWCQPLPMRRYCNP